MVSKKKASSEKKSTTNSKACVLCKQTTIDDINLGGLKSTKSFRAHYYCLLLSETMMQSGQDNEGILGFLYSDVQKELQKVKNKSCCYCKNKSASLGCVRAGCNRKFHLPCGLANNVQLNFNDFSSLCHAHRKVTNIPVYIKKALKEYKCVICLEFFNDDENISNLIWADCCRSDIVLHISCIKRLALNAGYFTKCPGCNNQENFIKTLKSLGVFVPERDASWELESDAFSELYYVHNSCDVPKCLCPQGREYSMTKGQWKVIRCKLCGSYGTHLGCTEVKKQFVCDICNLNTSSHAINSNVRGESSIANPIQQPATAANEIASPQCEAITEVLPNDHLSVNRTEQFEECNKSIPLQNELRISASVSSMIPSVKRKISDLAISESDQPSCKKKMTIIDLTVDETDLPDQLGDTIPDQKDINDESYIEKNITISSSAKLSNLIDFVEHVVEHEEDHLHLSEKNQRPALRSSNNQSGKMGDTNLNECRTCTPCTSKENELSHKRCNSPTFKISLDTNSEIEFVSRSDLNATEDCIVLSDDEETVNNITEITETKQENEIKKLNEEKTMESAGTFRRKSKTPMKLSEIKARKRIPRFKRRKRIVKIYFGQRTTYYAKVPLQTAQISYKRLYKYMRH